MTALVIAEYENFSIKDETLRVVTAAKKLSVSLVSCFRL